MKIFETHAHYDDEAFNEDREILLDKLLGENGPVECIVNVGASLRGCIASVDMAGRRSNVYAALGIHPEDIENVTDEDFLWLENEAKNNAKVVAIGEIGLDYHYPEPSREFQTEMFRKQLMMANRVKKPVIIHSRDACADTILCLKEENAGDLGGIIHCFSYTKESAGKFLNMGFYIGIGGVVTFKNARKLVEAVNYIPIDRLVLETDCPYMAPEPNRGKRNDSGNIIYVAQKIAQLKNLTVQEVIDITNNNAKKLFGL